MKIYLLSTLRVVNAEILPFDWSVTADEFLDTIATYQQAAGTLADLSPSRAAVERLKSALTRLEVAPIPARNGAIHELARILVPINYTNQPRFRHDPAFTVQPLPTIAVAADLADMTDPHLRRIAGVELMRGQNRLIAALDAAVRVVEQAVR